MVEEPENQEGISAGPPSGYRVFRTAPDELLRHDISDEELQVLADMRRDYLWEAMWVSLGIALGSAVTAADALFQRFTSESPAIMSVGALFHIAVFVAAITAFGILCLVMRNKSRTAMDLVQAIRERTREQIAGR